MAWIGILLAPIWTNKKFENQKLINLICWTLFDHPNHCGSCKGNLLISYFYRMHQFRTMNERVFSEPQFGLSSNSTFFPQWGENNFEGALFILFSRDLCETWIINYCVKCLSKNVLIFSSSFLLINLKGKT